jgi:CheY-like chemotaxis protein
VVTASDGSQALSLLREEKQHFDLVLSDVVMPGTFSQAQGMALLTTVPLSNGKPLRSTIRAVRPYGSEPEICSGFAHRNALINTPFVRALLIETPS